MRYAIVSKSSADRQQVEAYLPGNYQVVGEDEENIIIGGEDSLGWSLEEYVIPRLGSGLISCRELAEIPPGFVAEFVSTPDI